LKRIILFVCVIILLITEVTKGQTIDSTVSITDTLSLNQRDLDSLVAAGDSTLGKPKRQSSLEYEVNYQSDDSMEVDLDAQKVYLYGNAVATYGDIELKAAYIEISLRQNELRATGLPDSNGIIIGEPVFAQGDQLFDAGEMRYNFKTKRGLSKHVKTQESGGYLHGETVKRDTGEVIYIQDGKYTTCEYDEPHFHIHASKLKVIPKDKIITGPAYLSIADIPTPLVLPFGFFPNTDRRANGILLPTWTNTSNQGFGIMNGGYYFGVGEIMDFSLTGDVYTRGGYAASINSNYVKRYKFRGGYTLRYNRTVFAEKGYPDYSNTGTFNVRWSHSQDSKARPGTSFSASVDVGSSKGYRNDFNSSQEDFLKSQMNSSIKYSKSFQNSPFSLIMSASSSQNTQRQFISIRAPQASLNMARIYPFKGDTPRPSNSFMKKSGIEGVGIQGSADLINRLEGREDTVFSNYKNRMLRSMQNGVKVNSTMNTNITLLKYITLTPSTTHRLVGYRKTLRKEWDADSAELRAFYQDGLDGFYDGSASASLNTNIYGTYIFRNEIIKAMRHQITPSASISYRPDYTKEFWGYYDEVQKDTLGRTEQYSYFDQGAFSDRPAAQGNGVVTFNLINTLELKVRDRSDSTDDKQEKKLRLIDAFNLNTSYVMAADSLKWNPLRVAFRTKVVPGLSIDANATLDPYARSAKGTRINQFQYDKNGSVGTWTSAVVRFTYDIRPKKNKKKAGQLPRKEEQDRAVPVGYFTDFIDYALPWNINVRYNIQYSNNGTTESLKQVIDMQGQVQLTRNWQIGYRTGIDITKLDVTQTSIDIYRDLHCWEFSLGVVPFGIRERYTFQINVKPGMLDALKIPRKWEYNRPDRDQ